VVASLLIADVTTASLAWGRLVRRGFFVGARRPSRRLARLVAVYGIRAQVGGLISQLNLRLDFILLTALTGPAVLGVYAIASKFAELLKIVGMALTYVLYPKYAREGTAIATKGARSLIPRAGLLTAGGAVSLWLAAGFVIPTFYGSEFEAAISPARIILLGLVLEGVAAVITAYLYGVGRPGLNSWAMAAGLVMTVALDLALIPAYEAVGAAIASAVAYTTTSVALLSFFWWVRRAKPVPSLKAGRFSEAEAQ
jgi:O-antigen/teichoic acid export membrane protein